MVDFKKGIKEKESNKQGFPKAAPSGSHKKTKPGKTGMGLLPTGTVAGLLLALLAVTAIVYSNCLNNGFLQWDDAAYIKDNVAIHKLNWQHIKTIFSSFYMGNYHPLTSLTYAIEYSVVGSKSTFLYHIDNLLIHLVNIVLVYLVFTAFSRKPWVGLMVAGFFAVHPMHVESVAWISERKDVLYGCFFLLSLLMYLLYSRKRGFAGDAAETAKNPDKYLYLSILFFILALLSKSAAVVLPIILVLVDFYYRRKPDLRLILEKLPFFALSLLFGIVALKSQSEAQAMQELTGYSFFERILLINHSMIRYFYMAFIPAPLSALHPYPKMMGMPLPVIYYISPFITLILAGGLVYLLKTSRLPMFGFLFFLVCISLILQFIPVGAAMISERYTYMAHLGLFFVVCTWLDNLRNRDAILGFKAKMLIPGLVLVCLVVFSFITMSRNTVWKDDFSLWDDVVHKYPTTAYSAYYDRGKAQQDKEQMDGAFNDYCQVITMKPDYYKAYINRGIIRQGRKDYAAALADYNQAVKIKPDYYIVYNNRGAVRKLMGNVDSALMDFNRGIELEPNFIEAIYNRGTVFYSRQQFDKALKDFDKTLDLDPNYVRSYNYRGATRYGLGDKTGACRDWQTGLEMGDQTCKENLERNCK